jgi:TRAP-type mannitol/chloroaromatic compound transport system permease small subunit
MTAISKVMNAIDTVNRWVGRILYPVTILIAVVVFVEIFLRYCFNRPTLWSFETTQFLFILCSMLAAGHLQLENGHVNVDIISSRFSERTQVLVSLFTFPFFLIFVGSMAYFGFQFALESVRISETSGSAWDPPVYPVKILIPVGAILLLLQGIVQIIKQIQTLQKKPPGRRNGPPG